MQAPPKSANEALRLSALYGLKILDTPREERFDRITRSAQRLFGVPIALLSLVDAERQWFKSRTGLAVEQTPRDISFCGHAILNDALFVIENALDDARFADNPLVTGDPDIRFYAGCPLHGPGDVLLGTLCIIDSKPRRFPEADRQALRDLGAWAENELVNVSERRLLDVLVLQRAILDSANFTIISTDLDGLIRTFNRGAEQMLGYRQDEVVGRLTPAIIHDPEEVVRRAGVLTRELGEPVEPGFKTFVIKADRLNVPDENEWTYIRKDGSRFPVLLSVTALRDAAGAVTGYLGIGYDLSERKRLERMKSEFISTVSHELRTPLTSIRGSLGLIAGGAVGAVPDKARALIDIASNNSERLVRLINDILDVERIESGKMVFRIVPVDLVELVREAIEANHAYAEQHRVVYVLRGHPSGMPVDADADRLTQVLTNLLANAAKFSPAGSQVDVAVSAIKDHVRVSVTDHGPGIPEEFQDRIFQKFAQADSSDTRVKGGSGLGLSISRAIIERLGGTIGFTTGAGGTTFYFDLRPSAGGAVPES